MALFTVDSEQVVASATQVSATAERIRSEVTGMMSQLLALQDSWSGTAQLNFHNCISSWQATQTQVEQSLETISAQLHQAASVYADAESQSAALFIR